MIHSTLRVPSVPTLPFARRILNDVLLGGVMSIREALEPVLKIFLHLESFWVHGRGF